MILVMWALRVFLGSLFLVSALRKVHARDQFNTVIFLLSGVFRRWYKRIGDLVLVSEVVIGLSLIANLAPKATPAAALTLILVFDVVLIVLFVGHPGLECGCFGSRTKQGVQRIDVARNAVITCSFIGLLTYQRFTPTDRHVAANITILVLVLVLITAWEYRPHGRRSKHRQAGTRDV